VFYHSRPTVPRIILDGKTSSQLSLDLRTGWPTAVHAGISCAEQRAACLAINRERSRGILEATQQSASGEPVSSDAWLAFVARQAAKREIPLIPLSALGIEHDEDGMRSSTLLSAFKPGAEASPYFDRDLGVVYKLFDLRVNGSLGKKIELVSDEEGHFDVQLHDAMLPDTLEKLSILNAAGAHPTEIVGLSDTGDYLIVKQPLAGPAKKYLVDRDAAVGHMRGVIPPVTGLRRMVAVIWVEEQPWLVSDLHPLNIMRDQHGLPTVIDALTGPVSAKAIGKLQWLREAVEDAQALREGRPLMKRKRFEDVDDDLL
jgi:hypothetical protein